MPGLHPDSHCHQRRIRSVSEVCAITVIGLMNRWIYGRAGLIVVACLAVPSWAADDPTALEKQRCPKPTEFAVVFSFGYAGDHMPKDDDKFEELLKKIKAGG